MQEPSKHTKIEEGVLKELSGGDPLQARGLFKEAETFIPQFTLVTCTNSLFDINSDDDGTWRRMRLCPFVAKFVDTLSPIKVNMSTIPIAERVYEFIKDKKLKERLPIWAPVFAGMLVHKAFETQGVVEDCDIVLGETNKYRKCQNHFAMFASECIEKVPDGTGVVKKAELNEEFKLWYSEHQGGRPLPRGTELHDYIDKKFGKFNSPAKAWLNIRITKYATPDALHIINP